MVGMMPNDDSEDYDLVVDGKKMYNTRRHFPRLDDEDNIHLPMPSKKVEKKKITFSQAFHDILY